MKNPVLSRLSQKQEKFKISHSERSEESSKINRLRKLDSSATHQNDTFETASNEYRFPDSSVITQNKLFEKIPLM